MCDDYADDYYAHLFPSIGAATNALAGRSAAITMAAPKTALRRLSDAGADRDAARERCGACPGHLFVFPRSSSRGHDLQKREPDDSSLSFFTAGSTFSSANSLCPHSRGVHERALECSGSRHLAALSLLHSLQLSTSFLHRPSS
eukprot:GHVU01199338.1.p1 GENE.GHVU01199338.1~~GHVU01199338.1.p1  ORF type:complete len:144 (-),score=1.67 GHVU01199338.1:1452-1883(-)